MDQLSQAFGEDFVEDFQQERAKRAQQRNAVPEEELKMIADKIINQDAFEGGEPMFNYTSETGVTNHVLLMQLPEPSGEKDIWGYVNKLSSGAVTCPMDWMGEWWSCLFNNPDDLQKLESGDFAVIIGKLDKWENDAGEVNDQISPVRGLLTLEEVKSYADGELDDAGFVDDTEPEPEPEPEVEEEPEEDEQEESTEDSDSDDSSGPLFGGDDDEDDEEDDRGEQTSVPRDRVSTELNKLGAQHEEVWEAVGNEDRLKKLAKIINQELDDYDPDDPQELVDCIESLINEHNDDDEEDEEERLF